jgi:hypothetical protein
MKGTQVNQTGQYYRFFFVKDEGFREVVAESGLLRGRSVEGMSYDDMVSALDPADDIGELLFDERAAKSPVFSEAKGWWLEEYILKPFLPKEIAKLVIVEWKPESYIEGRDIDGS